MDNYILLREVEDCSLVRIVDEFGDEKFTLYLTPDEAAFCWNASDDVLALVEVRDETAEVQFLCDELTGDYWMPFGIAPNEETEILRRFIRLALAYTHDGCIIYEELKDDEELED